MDRHGPRGLMGGVNEIVWEAAILFLTHLIAQELSAV